MLKDPVLCDRIPPRSFLLCDRDSLSCYGMCVTALSAFTCPWPLNEL